MAVLVLLLLVAGYWLPVKCNKSQNSNPKIAPFVYLNFGYWNLFVICTLFFGFLFGNRQSSTEPKASSAKLIINHQYSLVNL
jgi:hypothetical protein